jgi:DnaJ-class molecular chaperone
MMTKMYPCQECEGSGVIVDDYISFGMGLHPITYPCGWCNGSGTVTGKIRSKWLQMKKKEKNVIGPVQDG